MRCNRAMMHTGQWVASLGAMSQMWQKKAIPKPVDKVNFGVKVNSTPSTFRGLSEGDSGK